MNGNGGTKITKPFGFITINYNIENLCYKTVKEKFVILSPEITIEGESFTTRWKLIVFPKLVRDGRNEFSVNLYRVCYTPGSDNISISLKVSVYNGEKSLSAYYDDNFSYLACEIASYDANHLLEYLELNEYRPEEFKIQCFMIVKNDNITRIPDEPSDSGLRLLSNDLTNLLQTAADSDLKIITRDCKEISCHKAILSARSSVLSRYIQENINYPGNLNYDDMGKILWYIYSGDIEVIANHVSFGMYEWLKFMEFRGIIDYFGPTNYSFHSMFDIEEYKFFWSVESACVSFDDYGIMNNKCISSLDFYLREANLTLRLNLFTHGFDMHDEMQYVSITADILEGSAPERGCFTFFIKNASDDDDVWSKKSVVINDLRPFNGKQIIIRKFISRKSFESKIKNCLNFNVGLILQVYSYNSQTLLVFTAAEECNFPKDYFYNCLSDDLAYMLEQSVKNGTVDQSDTLLEVEEGRCIGIHKCLLNARSPALRSMISIKNNQCTINLNRMKKSVIEVVLYWVYSGKLKNCGAEEILEVYKAAKFFNLIDLKEKCSEKVKQLLTVESVCDTLLFSIEENDQRLKTSVLHFIRDNRYKVFREDAWKTLVVKHPGLCHGVREFANWNPF